MYARITRDILDLTDTLGPEFDRTDKVVVNDATVIEVPPPGLLHIRLLDDDRNLYYEAVADDEALEELMSWAMRDSGCTILQTRNDAGEWEDCIG